MNESQEVEVYEKLCDDFCDAVEERACTYIVVGKRHVQNNGFERSLKYHPLYGRYRPRVLRKLPRRIIYQIQDCLRVDTDIILQAVRHYFDDHVADGLYFYVRDHVMDKKDFICGQILKHIESYVLGRMAYAYQQMKKEISQLRDELEELRTHIRTMPDGELYFEAREEWKTDVRVMEMRKNDSKKS